MRTGIILNHTGFSMLNYLVINEINQKVTESVDDICIFCENISNRVMEPHCSVVDTSELPSLTTGVLISFDLSSAQTLAKACTPAKKVLFLWDIEWLYNNADFNTIYDILTDESFTVIVRTETHKKILENTTGREPDGILEDFDLERIHEICEGT